MCFYIWESELFHSTHTILVIKQNSEFDENENMWIDALLKNLYYYSSKRDVDTWFIALSDGCF